MIGTAEEPSQGRNLRHLLGSTHKKSTGHLWNYSRLHVPRERFFLESPVIFFKVKIGGSRHPPYGNSSIDSINPKTQTKYYKVRKNHLVIVIYCFMFYLRVNLDIPIRNFLENNFEFYFKGIVCQLSKLYVLSPNKSRKCRYTSVMEMDEGFVKTVGFSYQPKICGKTSVRRLLSDFTPLFFTRPFHPPVKSWDSLFTGRLYLHQFRLCIKSAL